MRSLLRAIATWVGKEAFPAVESQLVERASADASPSHDTRPPRA